MFSTKKSAGRHLILDVREIPNTDMLTDKETMLKLMDVICEMLDLTIINKNHHQFSNGAITAIYMLGESHISIHTFPERAHVAFDLFTCHEYESDKELQDTAGFIITILEGSLKSDFRIINRKF